MNRRAFARVFSGIHASRIIDYRRAAFYGPAGEYDVTGNDEIVGGDPGDDVIVCRVVPHRNDDKASIVGLLDRQWTVGYEHRVDLSAVRGSLDYPSDRCGARIAVDPDGKTGHSSRSATSVTDAMGTDARYKRADPEKTVGSGVGEM